MTIVRRNPLHSAVGALLAVGLLVSGVLAATGNIKRAATTCDPSGFGFQAGYGYGYTHDPQFGYGCNPAGGGGGGTPRGYYEVAADGGVFAFNAPLKGSMGGIPANRPVRGLATGPGGPGYWLVASDGGI